MNWNIDQCIPNKKKLNEKYKKNISVYKVSVSPTLSLKYFRSSISQTKAKHGNSPLTKSLSSFQDFNKSVEISSRFSQTIGNLVISLYPCN